MQSDHERAIRAESQDGQAEPGNRRGLLLQHELVATRANREPLPDIRGEFVLSFCQWLIRNTPGGDVLWLSAHAAIKETGATEEEMAVLLTAIQQGRTKAEDDFFGGVER